MTATPQARSATIYSVADLAGVSIASVSRVMQGSVKVSDATREKVLDAAARLNYIPLGAARSLAVQHHEAHGLILPELSGPYYSELLLGFETRAAELGQSVVVLLTGGKDDVSRAVRQLATRVDGVAMLAAASVTDEVVRGLSGGRPLVMISGDPRSGVETVGAENRDSAAALTRHLMADHGRRQLLFVGDPEAAPDVRDRYRGFCEAHSAMRRRPRPPLTTAFREAHGVRVAEQLLAGQLRADAVVCANDELALSIMARLTDGGRSVPEAIAVVGWDDVMAARYIRPGLTTVRQPVHELGSIAAERLHERVTGGPPLTEPRILPTEVVLRTSCGCVTPSSGGHQTSPPQSPTKERQ